MAIVVVDVALKPEILDPQGRAIVHPIVYVSLYRRPFGIRDIIEIGM